MPHLDNSPANAPNHSPCDSVIKDLSQERAMLPIIEEKRDEIAALCRANGVQKLEVFGSAVTDEFDPARSDIDFIVHYRPDADLGPWLSRYQQLREVLATLLGREVDLVMAGAGAFRNPFFVREAQKTRIVIFDASKVRSPAA